MDSQSEQVAHKVKRFVQGIAEDRQILAAYLFGSWAQDRATAESDIDVGLILRGRPSAQDRGELYWLGKQYDADFDVVLVAEEDFRSEDPVIVHEMKLKGIRLL